MSQSPPTARVADAVAAPFVGERRAYVRLAADLAAVCRPVNRLSDIGWPGVVGNLSQGGVGLVMRHRFEIGTRLAVELRAATGAPLHTVPARVVHATPAAANGMPCWLLGCAFDRPLTEEEFQNLRREGDHRVP
jgi:hypothetical protein